MRARALVLHDLESTGVADAATVSALEAAVADRGWWLEQWAEGHHFVVGLVAQDVQDALLESSGRWPLCRACDLLEPHALYVHPDLGGPDPTWVCEQAGIIVAAVGSQPRWLRSQQALVLRRSRSDRLEGSVSKPAPSAGARAAGPAPTACSGRRGRRCG